MWLSWYRMYKPSGIRVRCAEAGRFRRCKTRTYGEPGAVPTSTLSACRIGRGTVLEGMIPGVLLPPLLSYAMGTRAGSPIRVSLTKPIRESWRAFRCRPLAVQPFGLSMNWLEPPKRHDVVAIPIIWIAVVLSLLV